MSTPPSLPPPLLPPSPPESPPAYPPLIICPPMAPPPSAPPGFSVWASQIPGWFWFMFVFMILFSCAGAWALYMVYKELRAQRLGQRLPGSETGQALADLERRVGLGGDVISRAMRRGRNGI